MATISPGSPFASSRASAAATSTPRPASASAPAPTAGSPPSGPAGVVGTARTAASRSGKAATDSISGIRTPRSSIRSALGPGDTRSAGAGGAWWPTAQPTALFNASPSAVASSGVSSTTSRPPPSNGTRITMPRPSLVTSRGPSPVRGFMAAMLNPFREQASEALQVIHYHRCGGMLGRRLPRGTPPIRARRRASLRATLDRSRTAMQARSALFDLYGDHLRHRGGVAPIAALVRLLAPLDIAAPAVRTAVSRMVRQGWLQAVDSDNVRGYGLSERATRRLDEAAARIYRHRPVEAWDGCWSIAIVSHSADRTTRERLHRAMEYLGYRHLQTDAWIAPRPAAELDSVVEAEGLPVTAFHGEHVGDQEAIVRRLFRPTELAADYRRWFDDAQALVGSADATDPENAFAARSRLLHEWRKFLFRDPGLPLELLPDDWPGEDAAAYFDAESARLLPAAA